MFITEIGVDYASEIINADVFNQQNWIGVMASAGAGATWYWKSVYDGAMLDRLSFISSFAAKIPFENGVKSVSYTSNSSTTGAMGYAADNKAWIWVYDSQSIITYTNRTPSAASNSTTKITIPISAGLHLRLRQHAHCVDVQLWSRRRAVHVDERDRLLGSGLWRH